jgi:hypothetical protein
MWELFNEAVSFPFSFSLGAFVPDPVLGSVFSIVPLFSLCCFSAALLNPLPFV